MLYRWSLLSQKNGGISGRGGRKGGAHTPTSYNFHCQVKKKKMQKNPSFCNKKWKKKKFHEHGTHNTGGRKKEGSPHCLLTLIKKEKRNQERTLNQKYKKKRGTGGTGRVGRNIPLQKNFVLYFTINILPFSCFLFVCFVCLFFLFELLFFVCFFLLFFFFLFVLQGSRRSPPKPKKGGDLGSKKFPHTMCKGWDAGKKLRSWHPKGSGRSHGTQHFYKMLT